MTNQFRHPRIKVTLMLIALIALMLISEWIAPARAAEFIATGYCDCRTCVDKWYGTPHSFVEGRTIAVDPTVIPLGSVVIVDGKAYIAEDTGGAIKGNRIDVYHDSHSDAWDFGRRLVQVRIVTAPLQTVTAA